MEMPMDLTEVKLRRKDVFEGKIMTVHVDDVRLPNGEEATREVVDHVDGAAVLALDEANRVLVVRQYRYVFGKVLDELPAGKLDPGEDPVTGALRELKEETGAEPETFLPLGKHPARSRLLRGNTAPVFGQGAEIQPAAAGPR